MIDPNIIMGVEIPDSFFNNETEDKDVVSPPVKLSENNCKFHRNFKIKRTKKYRYSTRGI